MYLKCTGCSEYFSFPEHFLYYELNNTCRMPGGDMSVLDRIPLAEFDAYFAGLDILHTAVAIEYCWCFECNRPSYAEYLPDLRQFDIAAGLRKCRDSETSKGIEDNLLVLSDTEFQRLYNLRLHRRTACKCLTCGTGNYVRLDANIRLEHEKCWGSPIEFIGIIRSGSAAPIVKVSYDSEGRLARANMEFRIKDWRSNQAFIDVYGTAVNQDVLRNAAYALLRGQGPVALNCIKELLDKSHAQVLGMAGVIHATGYNMDIDGSLVLAYLKQAISLSDGIAAYNLGNFLRTGLPGMAANDKSSTYYLHLAKEMGVDFSQHR
ncbi:hypothetical protein [Undibacterium sp. TS12]|uniref:hypothetical protein n=1 Tax=Undibacterium sp. TS12 TaxID=2908202 RepID=UPI001F4D0330|nr:hypothetical protein [Undibacterium sp. TS12]MCH8622481.1 hypothetical protein [Undibacterium sp. TS12]